MIKYTENQLASIHLTDGDVYVSAAAGSGKTAVLVERIVGILKDTDRRVKADRLLVVTYTKAAANEMIIRIKRRLIKESKANPKDEWLKRQILSLNRTNISTVHAFCNSLVREFWSELGISPEYKIADELTATDMSLEAATRASEILYRDKESGFSEFSDLFGRARDDADSLSSVLKFTEFLTNIADPKEWEKSFLNRLNSANTIGSSYNGLTMLSYVSECVKEAEKVMLEALEVIQKDKGIYEAYSKAFTSDLKFIKEFETIVSLGDWDECIQKLKSYEPMKLNQARDVDTNLRAKAQKLRKKVTKMLREDLLSDYFPITEAMYVEDEGYLKFAAEKLFYAADVYQAELTSIKKQRKILEFSDLERYALKLLDYDSPVRTEITSRFDHILVDEYQDTNEVQERIFELIKGEKGRFFAVGDVKQSIYSFRRAEPEIFIEKRKTAYPKEEGKYPVHILLSENFRSEANVIEAINNIFNTVMVDKVGDVSYSDGEALISSRKKSSNEEGIEVRLVDESLDTAKDVALLIKSMLEEGYLINESISDDGKVLQRKCRPSDFCILMRTKIEFDAFEQALNSLNIPTNVSKESGALGSYETNILIAFLSVIDNPRRDIDMTAVMLSPLYDFTPDDLLKIKGNDKRKDLYSAMLLSKEKKVKDFINEIERYRLISSTMPVDRFLIDLIDEKDAELLLSTGPSFQSRRDNIRKLIEIASVQSLTGGMTLQRFLKLIKKSKGKGGSLEGGFTKSAGAVDILSVHKAKGLEWPIVILANSHKSFDFRDTQGVSVLFDRALGIGIKYRAEINGEDSVVALKSTLQLKTIIANQKRKTVSEECRILYVALTRAKQKVFVTANVKNIESTIPEIKKEKPPSEYTLGNTKNHFDWIMYGINEDKEIVVNALIDKGQFTDGNISIKVVSLDADKDIKEEQKVDVYTVNTSIEEFKERINNRYLYEPLSEVPAKLTVSELIGNYEYAPRIPTFMDNSKLSAMERGSLIHTFMQYANLRSATVSVKDEINSLVQKGHIKEEYIGLINTEQLNKFFSSEIGKRIAFGETIREYAFIDAITASTIMELPKEVAEEKIIIQGVIDCILFEQDGAVLVDYKSDRVDSGDILKERYAKQLELYKGAIEKGFQVQVKESYIYSFYLNEAIKV